MLSLREFERAAQLLEQFLLGARLDKLVQPDATSLVLGFRPVDKNAGKPALLLSCSRDFARVSQLEAVPQAPRTPPNFCQLLRARLGRAELVAVSIRNQDRQLSLRFRAKEGEFELLLCLLGARSNLYLLDAGGTLLAALRPLSETRRNLKLGEAWVDPERRPGSEGEDRFAAVADAEFLQAIEADYATREQEGRSDELSRTLRRVIKKERDRLAHKLKQAQEDAQSGERAIEYQRQGELLKTVLQKVEPGAREVVAQDFESGEPVTVPLDPTLSAQANLERLFKRYDKAIKRATVAGGQLAHLEEASEKLEALAEQLETLLVDEPPDAQALTELAAHPELARVLSRYAPQAKPKASRARKRSDVPMRLLPKRYRASGGLEIWVGKSDEGNDYLTTRLARGKDLFVHLEASPGSHVILRTEGRSDPPSEALLEACELAVHFSKHREASRASVHVVPIKNVSKPKGAKPGLVYVTGGRTVQLRRDPKRRARILEARIPDDE